ncbi:DNA (cytosine-5)-methyltransferase 1 [Candidatus Gastranaerophilus sp. (ex Termes propinquus)]|nr:DNA (cytosine-5)-methyltransferase 1 [Candidatus Gastranaerophilus sp. (ex Termes propinquus)]
MQNRKNAKERLVARREARKNTRQLGRKKYSYINLFSGIGCWEEGFKGLPLENILSCEIDKYARETFLANFKHLKCVKEGRYYEDILALNPKDIPDFDILVASPPCQSFSVVGKRRGLKEERDGIGQMFFRVLDILKAKRPKAFILENVKGLLSVEGGESFKLIQKLFREAEYSFHWKVIRGDECGIPQIRQRVFMVGFLGEKQEESKFCFPTRVKLKYTLRDIFKCETVDREVGRTLMTMRWDKKFGEDFNFSTYMVDGKERTITINEGKEIMGLPRDFKMPVSENRQRKQLGNGIIPACGRLVVKQMIKHLHLLYAAEYNLVNES